MQFVMSAHTNRWELTTPAQTVMCITVNGIITEGVCAGQPLDNLLCVMRKDGEVTIRQIEGHVC
jgi:hypothetical protein